MSDDDLPTSVKFGTAGLGGILGWVIVHPFNTFAVRMSLASSQPGYVPMSFFRFGMKTVAEKGVWSAYEGLAAGCTRQIFYATSRFGLFEVFRDKLHDLRGSVGPAERVAAGLASGACAAVISCPAEVSLVRMSNDATVAPDQRRNYKGVGDAFSRIAKEEGIATFWRGCAPFVQRAMLVGIVQVGTFDQNKVLFEQYAGMKRGTYPNIFAASFASGLMYSIVTLPFETAKNRMAFQKPDANGVLPYAPAHAASARMPSASTESDTGNRCAEQVQIHRADDDRCGEGERRADAVERLHAVLLPVRRAHRVHVRVCRAAAGPRHEHDLLIRLGGQRAYK